jgi:hypothetical protein
MAKNEGSATDGAAGFYLHGKFVGAGPGRAYGEGERRRQPYNVSVLVGRNVHTVEFPDEARAFAALRAAGDPAEFSPVQFRVFPRLGGARAARTQCWIVYAGEFLSE